MSSAGVLELPKNLPKTQNSHSKSLKAANSTSKRKSKHDRGGRKRSKSFSGCGLLINQKPVLPTKFLLGGNINDPLNLNSLQDEEINRAMNAVTPKSSPIPTPPRRKGQIDVIIPPNIHDPLNLIDCADDAEYEQQLCSPVKKGRKKRLKKRRTFSATEFTAPETLDGGIAKTPETLSDSAKIPDLPDTSSTTATVRKELTLDVKKETKAKRKSEEYGYVNKKFKFNAMDKIVSPVVPQPGAWLKRTNSMTKTKPRHNKKENEEVPQFKEKNSQFQYGNYNRYYGYRNKNNEGDHRLRVFSHHSYMFERKDILDIGCNIGHITLSIARDLGARYVTGIDIDPKLIHIARKNIKHYVKAIDSNTPKQYQDDTKLLNAKINKQKMSCEFFPISMPILYGPIDIPGFNDTSIGRGFPNNVSFKTCNYVLEDDSLLTLEQPRYDVILCLSITKWIHLNWGDAGIKHAFRRMYAQLRPGGKLILEPQNWASYKTKRKLTETIYNNYNKIEFFPDKFTEYLLSPVVGFAKSEILGYPLHQSKGFQRPIQVFTKSTMFLSERVEATPNNITPSNNGVYLDTLCPNFLKTDKFDAHSNVIDDEAMFNRYCDSMEDNAETSTVIEADLKQLDEENCSSQVQGDRTTTTFEDGKKTDDLNNTELDNT